MIQFKFLTGAVFRRRPPGEPAPATSDNSAFKLHYRVTFLILLLSCTIVCTRQYVGDHIDCIADRSIAPVINTYCFFSATFTLLEAGNVSIDVAHPGVGPVLPNKATIRHAYYQWVPFVLFGQAIAFYSVHFFWKKIEALRLTFMVEMAKEDLLTGQEIKNRLSVYKDWGFWLVTCQVLNCLNLILQVLLTDMFLGGRFLNLGFEWQERSTAVLDEVFPKVTKCTFHKFGPSGGVQVHDSMCVVALNIVNEKIYIILWYWYWIVGAVTIVDLLWRLITLTRSSIVLHFIWPDTRDATIVASRVSPFDWLFLYYLSGNVNKELFNRILFNYARLLENYSVNHRNQDGLLSLDDVDHPDVPHESYC